MDIRSQLLNSENKQMIITVNKIQIAYIDLLTMRDDDWPVEFSFNHDDLIVKGTVDRITNSEGV